MPTQLQSFVNDDNNWQSLPSAFVPITLRPSLESEFYSLSLFPPFVLLATSFPTLVQGITCDTCTSTKWLIGSQAAARDARCMLQRQG